ncbi:MAG: hypothetical protein K8R92_06465 [Planctomycetes bacterium]|nr:hypothetical protein [Planctomycetota bacterium]
MFKQSFITAASMILASTAFADLTINYSVDGLAGSPVVSAGTLTEAGLSFIDSRSGDDWSIQWDLLGDSVSTPSLISNGFTITNTSASSKTFDILVAFDISNWDGPTYCFGNLFGAVNGTVTSSTPMWQGYLGGFAVVDLFPEYSATDGGFGDTIPPFELLQGSGGTLGYHMKFTLDGNSDVSFIGAWNAGAGAIPSPGALALVLCGCVCGLKQRRTW